MSKSDAQRRSYLADQMSFGDRLDQLERRIADLESSGTTRTSSPTECGRIVVDAGEWDRLLKIATAVDSFTRPGRVYLWSGLEDAITDLRRTLKR